MDENPTLDPDHNTSRGITIPLFIGIESGIAKKLKIRHPPKRVSIIHRILSKKSANIVKQTTTELLIFRCYSGRGARQSNIGTNDDPSFIPLVFYLVPLDVSLCKSTLDGTLCKSALVLRNSSTARGVRSFARFRRYEFG